MKAATLTQNTILSHRRLDSKYFLSDGVRATLHLESAQKQGLRLEILGGERGIAKCWKPNTCKIIHAVKGEDKVPYIQPYDIFKYLPVAASWLSRSKIKNLAAYEIKPEMILQTASGRNLGPLASADSYISKFIIGSDMIRIEIEDEVERYYVLTYLKSKIGQDLLKQNKTGSVIDHLSPAQLESKLVPRFGNNDEQKISRKMKKAVAIREKARETIESIFVSYENQLPPIPRDVALKEGWTVRAKNLHGRLDAAPHNPVLQKIRQELKKNGAEQLKKFAKINKPAGRYKTRYVSQEYGTPILSGRQILQASPINLQYIAQNVLSNPVRYTLRSGHIAFQADGRAEGDLAIPVMINSERDGWLANGHVCRLNPKNDVDCGWLYLAIRSWHAQIQLRALPRGAVVDALYERDIESVVLPPSLNIDAKQISHAWNLFAKSQIEENKAIIELESLLNNFLK